MRKVRILVADGQNLFREGLRSIIDLEPDMEVVGTARNGIEVCNMAQSLLPDVVILDVELDQMDGVEATRWIKTNLPSIKVIVLTVSGSEGLLLRALAAKANGFVMKDVGWEQLLENIRCAMNDKLVLSASIAETLSKLMARFQSTLPVAAEENEQSLKRIQFSGKELEIVELMAQGLSNREIAARLKYSDGTIRNYISVIYEKLGNNNRAQAVIRLRNLGLGKGQTVQ